MNHLELIQKIRADYSSNEYFFLVPDAFSISRQQMAFPDIEHEIDKLYRYWFWRNVELDFSITLDEGKYWNRASLEMQDRKCVNIIMNNQEIRNIKI